MTQPVIIAHGGAGGIFYPQRRDHGLRESIQEGYEILERGGSSLDAVEHAVSMLEDFPIFNAGTGSTVGLNGTVEMDASIMTSRMEFGAVAAIRNVRNPIRLARLVMEKTDHMILSGDGAVRFARIMGVPFYNPKTPEKILMWRRARQTLKRDRSPRLQKLADEYSTVGVVALDRRGLLCVGTSTGGMPLHLPGRIGDTPVIGGGTYCDSSGGVSTTGHGEEIMKLLLAFRAVQLLQRYPAPVAGRMAIDLATKNKCRCGLVGLDRKGRIMCVQNTGGMSWCYIKSGVLKSFWKKD